MTLKILESISNNKYLIQHNEAIFSQKDQINPSDSNQQQKQQKSDNIIGLENELESSKFAYGENTKNELFLNNLNNNNLKSENNQNEQEENILDFIIVNNQIPSTVDIKENNDFKYFYLKILWKFASDSTFYDGLSPTIIAKSRKIFSNILLKPIFKNELIKYIKKSIIGIGLNQKLNTNLNFLENILKNIKNYLSNNKNTNSNFNGNNQEININSIPNNITNQNEIDFLNKNLNILHYFSYEIKDFTGLINYFEKNYQLTSTIFHAIVSVKKETMYLADEIISIQEKINPNQAKESIENEESIKQLATKQTLLNEIISHFNEQIANINKHRIEHNNNFNNFINVQKVPNSKYTIENEMEIDLEDRDNIRIDNNFQVIQVHPKKSEKKDYILASNFESNSNSNKISDKHDNSNLNKDKENFIISNFAKNPSNEKVLKKDYDEILITHETDLNTNSNNNNLINVNVINMDETLSTEKSFEDSISSYSREISNLDKSKIYILKEFLEKNYKSFLDQISFCDNHEFIFKYIKLNFKNQSYYQVIESLLEFLKFIIFSSTIQISQQQIEYLNVLLIENSLDEQEMNIFFNFFAEIFRFQQLTKQRFISDENLNYLLFDILLKLEIQDIPASGFNLFKQIFFYINTLHNNFKLTSQNITDIKNFKSILAFETLWKFYIETSNNNVLNDAKNLLVNLISTITKNEENAEALIIIFQKVFSDLENILSNLFNSKIYQKNSLNIINENNLINNNLLYGDEMNVKNKHINEDVVLNYSEKNMITENLEDENNYIVNPKSQNNLEIEISSLKKSEEKAIRLIKLLTTLNSKQKLDKPKAAEIVTVNFHNSYYKDIKKVPMQLPINTKIKDLKQIIISKIIFPGIESSGIGDNQLIQDYKQFIDENSIMLLYKGKILNNNKFTLKDYKFDNNGIVNIHKGDVDSTEMEIDECTLKEYVGQVKFVFELDDEVIKRALKKNTYKIEDTIIYLTDETNIATIQMEIQEGNFCAVNDIENKLNIEIFKEKEVKMLLGFLNLFCESLSNEMWELLANIKYPSNLISGLIDNEIIKFSNIFRIEDLNNTLFNLKIINCLIFNDKFFTNIGKLDDSKKLEWKINLIASDGIDDVLKLLIKCVEELENLQTSNNQLIDKDTINSPFNDNYTSFNKDINTNKINVLYQIIQILSKWMHYFTMCASYSIANIKDNINFVVKQIIQNRPSGSKIGVEQSANQNQSQINSSKDSSPSQTTPTFGSPHSSFSEGIKSTSFKQKSYLHLGNIDENDNFLDEDAAHKYFSRIIFMNFHMCLLQFFSVSKYYINIKEIQADNETIFLNFLEILIIYNEMK